MINQLLQYAGVFTDIGLLWNEREFRRLIYSVSRAPFFLFGLLAVGICFGYIGYYAKMWAMIVVLALSIFYLGRLALRRSPFVIEVGVIVSRGGYESQLKTSVEKVAGGYLSLVSGILWSEIAIGLLAIWFPFHRHPQWAIVLILASVGIALISTDRRWWKNIATAVFLLTIAGALFAIVLPKSAERLAGWAGGLDCTLNPGHADCKPLPGAAPVGVPARDAVLGTAEVEPHREVVTSIRLVAGTRACFVADNPFFYVDNVTGGVVQFDAGEECVRVHRSGVVVLRGGDHKSVVQVLRG